jgi:hypothetical protein
MAKRWNCSRRAGRGGWAPGIVLLSLLVWGAPAGAAGQGLTARCDDSADPAHCRLAVAGVHAVQERVGTVLWGGNPVPGTASTLGMRIGSSPRYTVAGRVLLVPMTVPPLTSGDRAETGILGGLGIQGAVGLHPGLSPLPTVGGVLSVDAVGSLSLGLLPTGRGFEDGTVFGWSAGLRVGALRESFTLPGVSFTALYGRSGAVGLDDPGGQVRTPVTDVKALVAVSQRVSALRLAGGLAWDRYSSRATVEYTVPPAAGTERWTGRVATERWSGFVNASWTVLIFHSTAELGWQRIPEADGLPTWVDLDPTGWWGGVSFRVTL